MLKPDWWPRNPYPESVFPATQADYERAIPDPATRTSISGFLGRMFWDIAADDIWTLMQEDVNQ